MAVPMVDVKVTKYYPYRTAEHSRTIVTMRDAETFEMLREQLSALAGVPPDNHCGFQVETYYGDKFYVFFHDLVAYLSFGVNVRKPDRVVENPRGLVH